MKKGLLSFLILLICSFLSVNAATYYSYNSGGAGAYSWQTLTNWNSVRTGGGSNPSNMTTSGDIFVIQNGYTMNVTTTTNATIGAGVKVQIESGGVITATAAMTFNATATFQIDNGGTYNHSHTGTISNVLAGTEIMGASSNFNVTAAAQITNGTTVSSPGLGNFTYSSSGTMQCAAAFPDLQGSLTINPSTAGTLRLAASTAGRTTYNIGGDLIISNSGTLDFGNGSVVGLTINLSGNLNVSATGTTNTTTPFVFVGTGGVSGTPVSANLNFVKSGTQTFTNTNTTMMTALAASFRQINITVNSGSTIDFGTSVLQTASASTINFTLSSGAGLITANTNGITAANTASGSVQNATGTRTFNTGANYTFNASSAQAAGSGFTGAANLTINNSSGVSLSAAAAVTGTLTFTSGKLDLGANNLTLTGATVSGASSSNYFVTSGAGKIVRSITNGGPSFVFPIGRSGSTYNPVTITNTGASTSVYTVGVASTTYSPSADGANAQWSIASGTSTTSTFAFSWTTADAGANLTASPTSGNIYSYNGSSWATTGGTTSAGTPNVTTQSGITSANTIWTVAMPAAVPDIALADNSGGQVAAGNIIKNTTNNVIYNFQLGVTTANATLNSVAFATTNSASDVSNFKLYYASTNSFGSASQIGTSVTTGLGTGTHTFSSLTQVINSGATGYFWIVSDVPSGATSGNTIAVTAITTSDITFASGNKTGSTTGGGTQTIIAAPTVTTNAASSITTTGVVLNGTVNANANSTTASFDYGSTISYGTNVVADQSPVTGTSNTAITKTISSLGTNTLYNFRAKGVNTVGTTNGSNATFTTLSNAPTVGSGNAETSVGFTANWTAPTNDGSETYTFTVEVDDDNAFGSINATYSGISSGSTAQVVTGLASGTTFYFRVKAVNAGGSSAWSSVSAGVTTTSSVAPTVTTTSISSITLASASGGGNVISDGGDAVTARGIVYNTTGNPTLSDITTTDGTGTGSFTSSLSGLSNNTTYYVKAYATNGIGTSYGSEVSFTTLAVEPTAQSTVTFGTKTTTSLVVNFSGGDGARRVVFVKQGSAVSYTPSDGTSPSGINAAFGSGTLFGTGNYAVYDGTGSTVTVTGLTANTAYHIAVYEYNNNSAGVPNYFASAGTANTTTYNPTITLGALTPGGAFASQVVSTTSTAKSYTLTGSELVSDITVTSPSTSFLISSDNISYSSSPITLAKDGSDAVSATIYVKYSPVAADGATGTLNIINSATSATVQNKAVSGNAIEAAPTTKGSISFSNVTSTQLDVNLPTIGDGGKRIIIVKSGSAPTDPTDGTIYTANTVFGSGSNVGGTGSYVIFNGVGSGSSIVTLTGLTPNTTYYFAVYEYNEGTGTSQNYATSVAMIVSATQTTPDGTISTDYFRSVATGNLSDNTIWESSHDGSSGWIAATSAPTSSATNILVQSPNIITVATSITINDMTINSGGELDVSSGQILTITTAKSVVVNGYLKNIGTITNNGTITVNSGATYEHNKSQSGTGAISFPANITYNSGGNLKVTGTFSGLSAASGPSFPIGTYKNVEFNVDVQTADAYIQFGTTGGYTISEKLKISGTGVGAILIATSNNTSQTVGSFEQTGGNFYINRNSGGDRTLTVTNDATISGGICYLKTNAATSVGIMNVGGTFNSVGGTVTNAGTVSGTTAQLNFNGTTAQSASFGTVTATTAAIAFSVTGTGGVTLNTDLTLPINSSLILTSGNFTIASNKTLTLSGTSTISIPSGRTLTLNGTILNSSTTATSISNSGTFSVNGYYIHNTGLATMVSATWNTGSTCEIRSIGSGSSFAFGGQSFYHLVWNLATQGSTVQLSGSIAAINGNLEIQNCGNTAARYFRLCAATNYSLTIGGNLNISAVNGISGLDIGNSSGTNAILTVGGNVIIGSSGTILSTPTGAQIRVAGNWSNSGTFTPANTTVTFNGASSQSITGATTFNNLTVNNSNNISLNNDATVNSTLTFTAGKISTSSNKVIMSTGATISGGGTGWIIGNLQKNVASGTSVTRTFELGDASNYSPLSLTFASVTVAGNLIASVDNTDHSQISNSGIDAAKSVNRYWSLTNSGITYTNYSPTFTYVSADNDAGTTPANYVVRVYNGSTWATTTLSSTPTSTSAVATSITVIGSFAIGEVTGTPVVTTNPSDANVCSNSVATFSANSTSIPTPTAQWQISTNGGVSFTNITDGGIYSGATTNTLSISSVTGINGNMYRVVYSNINGSSSPSTNANLIVGNIWSPTAATTSWSSATNWACLSVPATNDNIAIGTSIRYPVLSANTSIASLALDAGTSFSLNGYTLTINGVVTSSTTTGNFIGSPSSSLILNGTGALGTLNFDQTTDGTTNTLASLTLNRTSSGSATLGSKLVLIDALTPTAGTLNTGGYLHLRSRSTNTARIAAGSTSGGYINGDVTVERYMSSANSGVSNRAYRLITPSVTTTNYIRDNWQEGTNNPDVSTNNNPVTHYGTHVTGLAGNSAGFDVTQNNSNSLFNYNQTTNAWDAVTNTNATILDAKKGYLIFIRGSRNSLSTINTTTGYTDSLILRAKGSVAQGDQTFALTGVSGDFALVTNPFPAPIDWASIYTTNSSNFNNYVTIWDPNQGSRGGYVTVTSGGVTTPGTSSLTTNIQTGQAFFVQLNASAPTLNINEAHKSTTNNLNVYRTTASAERFNINLKYTASGAERNADGVTALIDNSYNNAVDGDDAEQIQNWDEDVALLRGNKELSIESRSNANTTDTLFLQTLRLRAAQANYKWEIEPLNIATITEASLIDNFTNTVTPLSLTNNTIINFTVSSNSASLAANRFKIVFKTNASLPVSVTKFTAQLKNNTVQLNWSTANEQNINNYEVERSVDGRTFSSIATVRASNSSAYNAIDNSPQYGINYYRLKINDQNGKINYSTIIKIQVGKQVSTLVTVYTNPIVNNVLSVQLVNAAKGSYSLSLYNIAGQKVYEKTLEHQGGSSTENLAIGSLLSLGQYQLRIIGNNGYQNTETIIKQ